MQYIENKAFDDISVGDSAELTRTLKTEDIELFAVMSGDVNPAHVDEEYARSDEFHEIIAYGMWGGALISAVLGTELPGPGTIYLNQSLSFRRPLGLGDTVTVRVTVTEKFAGNKRIKLDCLCLNQDGGVVIEGQAEVVAPAEKVRRPRVLLPEVHLHERGAQYRKLIAAMSHIFVLDVPHYAKPLLITDAAINIVPNLNDKRDIVQNGIDLALALGIVQPKVAILSAVETVSPQLPSTIDAAALCKMAGRGQITGGLVDGPLAFDNAVSKAAAATKSINSEVAGDADVLVAPDLEAANMIAKQLIYLAGAEAAGIVLGARVPIMLTSRADGDLARLASCALAQLFAHRRGQQIL